jgi:hypothetical protein
MRRHPDAHSHQPARGEKRRDEPLCAEVIAAKLQALVAIQGILDTRNAASG